MAVEEAILVGLADERVVENLGLVDADAGGVPAVDVVLVGGLPLGVPLGVLRGQALRWDVQNR